MDFTIGLIVFLVTTIGSLIYGVTLVVPLLIGYLCFVIIGLGRKNSISAIVQYSIAGIQDALVVVLVLFLIGILTASWRASGTILFFVYYGVQIITPKLFLIVTFLLACLLSYAIGTSFGVAGTLGVICMTLARSGGVNPLLAAGVIMSGIYFGDRCSPASSSMILTAAVTGTNPNQNMRKLLSTGWLPFGICLVVYGIFSYLNPIQHIGSDLLRAIEAAYTIHIVVVIPALFMLALPVFRVDVKIAMTLSVLSAGIISVFVQEIQIQDLLKMFFFGYQNGHGFFGQMLNGGGIISMLEVNAIVMISCTYSRIFQGTGMLIAVEEKMEETMKKIGRFPVTALSGLVFCAVFCNQTIATTMGAAILKKPYMNQGADRQELAIDIGNSTIVLAGIVPWAIASSVPLAFLGSSPAALPYACFLYLVPITYLMRKPQEKRQP